MSKLLRDTRYFLVPYIFTTINCVVLILIFSKPELHILLNKANSPFFDQFFKYITHLGDGMTIVILTIVLLFIRYRYALIFLLGGLVTSGIINLLKKVILDDIYRPSRYFELYETYQLHFIEGVKLHSLRSFPSGHTGTVFNVFFMLALIVPKNWQKLLCFGLAALGGYSRVYISQHFLIDVTVGSVLGIGFILLFFYWAAKWETPWLDKSLIRRK